MDDYRNKKRQKMRARRRRAQRIKMTGMCIATLIVFIFIVFLAISNLSKIKKNVTLEAGSEINIKDFLKKENADAKFVTDVSQINTGNIGSHEIVVKVGKKEYTSKLTIEDTKAPTAKANDVTVNKDGQIEANQFVTDIKDATKVDVSFKDKPDVSKDGESEVIIVLTDEGKNQKEVKAKLTVVSDSEPPVIDGVKDITAYIGETVSYKKDVTVTDNMDQNPTLDIDNSKVNLNKAGTYEVVYTATDSAGNTSSASSKITIKEKPKGYVDKEDVCGSKESDNDKKDVGSETKQDVFTYDLKGVTVAMNENMEPLVKKLGDADNYFESDSCAFQGKDKVYTYGSVKITTYPKDNKDYVYTIELLDDTVSTLEGISIGSDKKAVEEKYGDASDSTETSYIYKKGDSQLSFIFDGDNVSSIVYNAITE